jgi:hypothetical protein
MFSICKKELGQFFSSLTGIIAIVVFLLVNGIVLFVFRNNILDHLSNTCHHHAQLCRRIPVGKF